MKSNFLVLEKESDILKTKVLCKTEHNKKWMVWNISNTWFIYIVFELFITIVSVVFYFLNRVVLFIWVCHQTLFHLLNFDYASKKIRAYAKTSCTFTNSLGIKRLPKVHLKTAVYVTELNKKGWFKTWVTHDLHTEFLSLFFLTNTINTTGT